MMLLIRLVPLLAPAVLLERRLLDVLRERSQRLFLHLEAQIVIVFVQMLQHRVQLHLMILGYRLVSLLSRLDVEL